MKQTPMRHALCSLRFNGSTMSVIAIIPARYGSTRFPGKSLALINGRPMVQWVHERAKRAKLVDRVIIATDDERILNAVSAFGGEALMTSADHPTGTDRIAEVAQNLTCDLIVNIQGDEPLIHPDMIDEAITPLLKDASIPMGTVCNTLRDRDEAFDPNVVKVVFDGQGFALYFSRAPIPWDREAWKIPDAFTHGSVATTLHKHIGLYVYRREFLLRFASMRPTHLETIEKLEQLRALENGHKIMVVVSSHESFGVDIPEDLSKILKRLHKTGE